MCGRFIQITDPAMVGEVFPEIEIEACLEEPFEPHYNVAPTQNVLTLLNTPVPRLSLTRWGLIPSWSKDREIGSRLINARAETLAEKPSFRELFQRRRCAIVADGFFEWDAEKKPKIPYFFQTKTREPFALAGLWDHWKDPDTGSSILSSTIITTKPNTLVARIHNRMPAILTKDSMNIWLDSGQIHEKRLRECLKPFNEELMEMHAVSRLVNDRRNDAPELIMPAGAGQLHLSGRNH
jgi:putative SOS response-associated peptidase YedK